MYRLTRYHDYFDRNEINTFRRRYTVVLVPYDMNPAAAAAAAPADVARLIYAMAQEDILTVFLQ